MSYWAVDSADGQELTTGLNEFEAHGVAQRHANRLGESVYLYEVGSEDDAEEIEPEAGVADECPEGGFPGHPEDA